MRMNGFLYLKIRTVGLNRQSFFADNVENFLKIRPLF